MGKMRILAVVLGVFLVFLLAPEAADFTAMQVKTAADQASKIAADQTPKTPDLAKERAFAAAYGVRIIDGEIKFKNGKNLAFYRPDIFGNAPAMMVDENYALFAPPHENRVAKNGRSAEFLGRIYGADEATVRGHLARIKYPFFAPHLMSEAERLGVDEAREVGIEPDFVLFNTQNGAAAALERVFAELEMLAKNDPEVARALAYHSGAFLWRNVAGTHTPSPHAYGIAIDIAVDQAGYWRWEGERGQWRNPFPAAVIAAFERHGFIWGGRWECFDTMHFEYRPEILRYKMERER